MKDKIKQLFEYCEPVFSTRETASNWEKYHRLIEDLVVKLPNEGYFQIPDFNTRFFTILNPVCNSIKTDRTQLSLAAQKLALVLANGLREKFQPLVNQIVESLVVCLGRSNSVLHNSAFKCLGEIVKLHPFRGMLDILLRTQKDLNPFVRESATIYIDFYIFTVGLKFLETHETAIEKSIKLALEGAKLPLRHIGRLTYNCYIKRRPQRKKELDSTLTNDILNVLDKPPSLEYLKKILRPLTWDGAKNAGPQFDSIDEYDIEVDTSTNHTIYREPVPKPNVQHSHNYSQSQKLPSKSDTTSHKNNRSDTYPEKYVSKPVTTRISSKDERSGSSLSNSSSLKLKAFKPIVNHPMPDYSHIKPKIDTRREVPNSLKVNREPKRIQMNYPIFKNKPSSIPRPSSTGPQLVSKTASADVKNIPRINNRNPNVSNIEHSKSSISSNNLKPAAIVAKTPVGSASTRSFASKLGPPTSLKIIESKKPKLTNDVKPSINTKSSSVPYTSTRSTFRGPVTSLSGGCSVHPTIKPGVFKPPPPFKFEKVVDENGSSDKSHKYKVVHLQPGEEHYDFSQRCQEIKDYMKRKRDEHQEMVNVRYIRRATETNISVLPKNQFTLNLNKDNKEPSMKVKKTFPKVDPDTLTPPPFPMIPLHPVKFPLVWNCIVCRENIVNPVPLSDEQFTICRVHRESNS